MARGLGELDFVPLSSIDHLVHADEHFGHAVAMPGFQAFIDGLPDVLAARDLKRLIAASREARAAGRPIVWAMGAHSIKCGLTPWILAMAAGGFITAVAMNGACAIHDIELGLAAETSEDVASHIGDGTFGFADEPGLLLGRALEDYPDEGLGKALGRILADADLPRGDCSLLLGLHRLGVPVTFHAALGTDTVHFHPSVDWSKLGRALEIDFARFVETVGRLDGGVYFNVGSAVILPEVFLKAVSILRNRGVELGRFVTVNMDMIQHYRPRCNVLKRPGGEGLALTGHHEIMVPLLACALLSGEKAFSATGAAQGDGGGRGTGDHDDLPRSVPSRTEEK